VRGVLRIAIVVGSTRPNRLGRAVADWVHENAKGRGDAEFEILDVADYGLPLLDEPIPPSMGRYTQPHTKRWAEAVGRFDAYVFVTPEYNHGTSGALKNAIDFLYKEWNDKAAGFVGYGSLSGARAVESLRLVMAELQVATVRQQVGFSLGKDWAEYRDFRPAGKQEESLRTMLDQLVAWGSALRSVRERRGHGEAAPARPPRPAAGEEHRSQERGKEAKDSGLAGAAPA
jgi:NAD(P)H-dependent FMN reductase